MALVWLIVGAVLAVAAYSFGMQNSQTVDLVFFGLQFFRVPLWVMLLAFSLGGLVLGILVTMPSLLRGTVQRRRLSRQGLDQERTIGQLQQRVVELERDLSAARRATAPPQEERPPLSDVPGGPEGATRSQLHAA